MTTSQSQSDLQYVEDEKSIVDDDNALTDETTTTEQTCGECGGLVVEDESRGERVCNDCGLIVSTDTIDHGPDWLSFDDGDSGDQERHVGAPVTKTLHDKGLSTNIDWRNKDAYGNALSSEKRSQVQRLRKWNRRCKTTDSQDRNLMRALSEITRMASALGLDKGVEETAGVLYRRCLDEGMLPGRSIEGVSSACLYAAARICNTPRSLHEMHPVSQVSASHPGDGTSELNRAYLYLIRELDLEIKPVDPREYLNRMLSGVELSDREVVRKVAVDILDEFEKTNMHSGCSPVSLAAAAVYCAGGLHDQRVTQRELADVAGVCKVTIRNRYQEMLEVYENRDDVGHEFNIHCAPAERGD